jgi:hypothetical protein
MRFKSWTIGSVYEHERLEGLVESTDPNRPPQISVRLNQQEYRLREAAILHELKGHRGMMAGGLSRRANAEGLSQWKERMRGRVAGAKKTQKGGAAVGRPRERSPEYEIGFIIWIYTARNSIWNTRNSVGKFNFKFR